MVYIKVEDLSSLREALCVAQSAIGQAYGQRQSAYALGKIGSIQEVLDEIDILRPLGPDGKHGDRHTDFCGCDPNPLLILKRTWRKLPDFNGYEVSGDGRLRDADDLDPESYEYTPKISPDGLAWYDLWSGGNHYLMSRNELLLRTFPESKG